jgi:hypothetical protein
MLWEDRVLEVVRDRLGVLNLSDAQRHWLAEEGWETAYDLGNPPEEAADQIMEEIPRW